MFTMLKSFFIITSLFITLICQAQLNGTYTIGGASPNYATLAAAATALNTSGISGNVTFNIRPGSYIDDRLSLSSIPGTNTSRTIIFQAENGDSSSVIIQTTTSSAVNNFIIAAFNTLNITVRRLTIISPSNGTHAVAFQVYNTNGFKLENCYIKGNTNITTSSSNNDLVQIGGTCSAYQVKNCTMIGGDRTIALYGGSTQTLPNGIIENNKFKFSY